jgi:uncharacterized membrane protein
VKERDKPNIQLLLKRHSVAEIVLVLLSGLGLGFLLWRLSVDEVTFNSYLFFNNLSVQDRWMLMICLGASGVSLLLLWAITSFIASGRRPAAADRQSRLTGFFSVGLAAGFAPVLAVQAFEVYHAFLFFCVAAAFLFAVLLTAFLISRGSSPGGISEGWSTRDGGDRLLQRENRISFIFIILLAAAYAVYFSFYTVGKHLAFHTFAFDLGWQNQVFYTLLETGYPRVTGFITIDHLSNHFQPLYYLLAPVYALHRDPITLLVMQSVLLASSSVPIYLVARGKTGNAWIALALAAGFLLHPALHGMNSFDFHGLVLLVPIFCFLIYFLESRRMTLFWIFLALALFTREDTAVTVSGVGLYAFFVLKRRRLGIVVLAVCAAYFFLVCRIMSVLGGFPNLENYWSLVLPEQQGFRGVLTTLFTNPLFVFRHIFFNADKLRYLISMLLPLLFLPLLAGRSLVLVLPGLAILLLSDGGPHFSLGFQYSAHILPQLYFLTIDGVVNLRRYLNRRRTHRFLKKVGPRAAPVLAVGLLFAGLLMNYELGLVLSKRFPGFLRPTDRERRVYTLFSQIPPSASVATLSRLYPHLSGRREIYLLHRMFSDAEYVLADLEAPQPAADLTELYLWGHTMSPASVKNLIIPLLRQKRYGVLFYQDGFILLKRGYRSEQDREVLWDIQASSPQEKPGPVPYFRDPAENVENPRYSESDRLLGFLRDHVNQTILIAARGEASTGLSYLTTQYLMFAGSRINTLRRHGGYAAVVHRGRVAAELIDNRGSVVLDSDDSPDLRSLLPGLDVTIESSGSKHDAGASIRVNGSEVSAGGIGLNVVVLDGRFRVVSSQLFATGK